MFKRILAPVDLAHADRLGRAIDAACDLAKHYDAELVFVGVTATTPTTEAHTPQEYQEKLAAFAAEQADRHGVAARAQGYTTPDPAVEVDRTLLRAIKETGADLVVMATHVPDIADAIWPSHGGDVAAHAAVSVFLVR